MPGFVNVKMGINYSFLQLPNNKSITKHITGKIGLPVFIDNDSSLIALAEFYFGGARSERNAMVDSMFRWLIALGGFNFLTQYFSTLKRPLFLQGPF